MKIAEAVSIAHAQRSALEEKAQAVLDDFVGVDFGGSDADVQELAELGLSAAHHWKLESPEKDEDKLGSVIGYAILVVVLVVLGLLAVWLIRSLVDVAFG